MNRANILSLETSSTVCGVTLTSNSEIVFSENITEPNSHDISLAPLIQKAVQHLELGFNSLDAVALSAGPGSFTGLRIGASMAKGICFDEAIKFISVPTMEALAWNMLEQTKQQFKNKIITVLPSRKSLYYIQRFTSDFKKLSEIEIFTEDKFAEEIDSNTFIVGLVPESIKINLPSKNLLILNSDIISYYANYLYGIKKFDDADKFEPIYVEDFKPKIQENF